ncbi:RlpA-like double-psi beta-barrel-protein domain-containing protein-containing protein [Radiomyces spectabilis]|uniref:RlpA-like double-psi beta-barrel-protein domain-containing protein-containing protein n=1 Tax=Radiomyces spectabilis TaxID=64574 RepID=UPI00222035B2|nr:RlpA-like double-psi beta-barrel-protein domain-containing protein-containing protein [Radiomyces spectabilis]KAI8377798.1 RlpA-like double-psi beta-barrel-protein domain-containing protein-containing protein [Radiomyces spectabilis]
MKPVVFLSFCVFFIVALFSFANAEQELEERGLATLMMFNNGTSPFEKRGGRGTWYTGEDLKNAACYDRNGLPPYSASIHSMIGAMAMKKFENCYKCMKITNNKHKNLSVVVKIVDKCAGCKVGKAIDLTPAAFKKIAPRGDLDIGVLDISWKVVKCSNSKYYPSKPKA